MMCEHANENPFVCPCPQQCECRQGMCATKPFRWNNAVNAVQYPTTRDDGTSLGGTKHDAGKPMMELLPPDVLVLIARVFTYGAKKYAAWNWCCGFEWSRLYGAGQRHLNAWWAGEDNDPESGLPHLGHALCCYMMLAAHELRRLGKDDRHRIITMRSPPPPPP